MVAAFDQAHSSSDGGAVLLKAADRRLGLIDGLAATLIDHRAAPQVQHSLRDLLAQRVFGIACGHADASDADALADDPIHKLLLDRDPITGGRLASQPTLSRFDQRDLLSLWRARSGALTHYKAGSARILNVGEARLNSYW